jgi:hypothetical protein
LRAGPTYVQPVEIESLRLILLAKAEAMIEFLVLVFIASCLLRRRSRRRRRPIILIQDIHIHAATAKP